MVEDGPDVEFGYVRAEPCGRRKLRWLGLLVIFAFVEPAHLRRSIKCRVPSLPRLYLVFHMTLQHLDLGITSRRGGINCCDDVRNAQLNAAPPPDSQHNDRDFAACEVLGNECSYRLLPARRTRRPRPRQGDRHFPIRRRLCTLGREGENGVNLFPRDAELLGQFVYGRVFNVFEYRRNRVRVPRNTQAPLRLPGTRSTPGHKDQSRSARIYPRFTCRWTGEKAIRLFLG